MEVVFGPCHAEHVVRWNHMFDRPARTFDIKSNLHAGADHGPLLLDPLPCRARVTPTRAGAALISFDVKTNLGVDGAWTAPGPIDSPILEGLDENGNGGLVLAADLHQRLGGSPAKA